ncbi:hypothetical protein trd_0545 [Thermomicrobium roseum DSM 5159]|uniref:Uncharacterized protein n=1 Tax=Thermomicrobium roseum (strain ATCC 27502 / DSM 5159 / P-2) TaxID=309801 RepID=B9KYJ9_THERP|nr:hypothetical protein trd_0545 [Thermomicrobium roseum DSM 5159]
MLGDRDGHCTDTSMGRNRCCVNRNPFPDGCYTAARRIGAR